jgi:hypothetical protein
MEYGDCKSGEWNTESVNAGSRIRGARKRGVEYGNCESGEWNTESVYAGSGIWGV